LAKGNPKKKGKKPAMAEFKWSRNRILDDTMAAILYEKTFEHSIATVTKISSSPRTRYRPKPLATIEFQKLGVRKLHISSHKLMELAERLYNYGWLSYPRTETDSFTGNIDLK